MTKPSKAELIGLIGVVLVTIAMLFWALFGSPPYAYFRVMKWVVAGTCCYSTWVCWTLNRALAPLGVVLVTVAAIHIFGKMRRNEWGLFNWIGIVALVLVIIVACIVLNRRQSEQLIRD